MITPYNRIDFNMRLDILLGYLTIPLLGPHFDWSVIPLQTGYIIVEKFRRLP